jgi:hypothetical protein
MHPVRQWSAPARRRQPAIENGDRITVEAWVNTLSWPGRAVVCRKEGSYILYNFNGGFSWYLSGPDNRLQYDIAGTLGNGSWGYIVGTYDKDAGANNQRLYLNGARVAQMRYREVEQGAFVASAGPASQGGRWRAPVLRTAAALTCRPRAGDGLARSRQPVAAELPGSPRWDERAPVTGNAVDGV